MDSRLQDLRQDEELKPLVPTFDTTSLSMFQQNRIKRYADREETTALMDAIRINCHNKVTMVSILCQGQVEEAVTMLLDRNPSRNAARNLFAIAEANAEYLCRGIYTEGNPFWR